MKKPRRPPSKRLPKLPGKTSRGKVVEYHPARIAPERLEAFREAYIETRGNAYKAALAIGMKPSTAKAGAWRIVRALKLQVAEALEMLGIDAVSQARKLIALREARLVKWNPSEEQWDTFLDSSTQMEATKEINKLLDAYPAAKRPPNETPPVQVFFGNLADYREHKYVSAKIIEHGSIQDQPQGNAGSGTPAQSEPRGSLLNPAPGKRKGKA